MLQPLEFARISGNAPRGLSSEVAVNDIMRSADDILLYGPNNEPARSGSLLRGLRGHMTEEIDPTVLEAMSWADLVKMGADGVDPDWYIKREMWRVIEARRKRKSLKTGLLSGFSRTVFINARAFTPAWVADLKQKVEQREKIAKDRETARLAEKFGVRLPKVDRSGLIS